MATIPAYSINGFTRPELILDGFGNIVLDDTAAAFAQTYGLKALFLGCNAGGKPSALLRLHALRSINQDWRASVGGAY